MLKPNCQCNTTFHGHWMRQGSKSVPIWRCTGCDAMSGTMRVHVAANFRTKYFATPKAQRKTMMASWVTRRVPEARQPVKVRIPECFCCSDSRVNVRKGSYMSYKGYTLCFTCYLEVTEKELCGQPTKKNTACQQYAPCRFHRQLSMF